MSGTKKDYIQYRIAKSRELFEDAKLLAQNKRWNSCVNRLYYSSFHLVNGLLHKQNHIAHTHNGAKTLFFNYFIKTEIIAKEHGRLFANLFAWRQESDYIEFVEFDEKTVLPLLDQVYSLNKEIEKHILDL